MSYRVEPTLQAEADLARLYDSLSELGPEVAARWYGAFWEAARRLETQPFACGLAYENDAFKEELRHLLFGTPKGKKYRALFIVQDDVVKILCVRAPGERPISPGDLGS